MLRQGARARFVDNCKLKAMRPLPLLLAQQVAAIGYCHSRSRVAATAEWGGKIVGKNDRKESTATRQTPANVCMCGRPNKIERTRDEKLKLN